MGQRQHDRRTTAYHEAGHVVAAVAFGIPILVASIVPNVGENEAGHVMQYEEHDVPDELVIYMLAGHAAARRIAPAATGEWGDEDKVSELLPSCGRSEVELRARTEQLVTDRWGAIDRVAFYLIKYGRLDGQALDVMADPEVTEGELNSYLQLAGLGTNGGVR